MQRRMEFLRVKEIKDISVLLIGNSLFLAIGQCLLPFSLHFWPSCYPFLVYMYPARQGIFVRDTLGPLGKCCKIRHSMTKP